MLSAEQQRKIIDSLVQVYKPLFIYLFGSHAWGIPDEQSDVDLMVVVSESNEKSYKRPILGYRALRQAGFAKDILVYTQQEFMDRVEHPSTLCHKIYKDGMLLYGSR